MASDTTRDNEMLVFNDPEGNYYAIPREMVERHKVTDEEKAELQNLMGDEVSGYSMYEQFMTQQRADTRYTELRQEADGVRRAAEAHPQASQGTKDSDAKRQSTSGLKGAFVGMWVTMTGAR